MLMRRLSFSVPTEAQTETTQANVAPAKPSEATAWHVQRLADHCGVKLKVSEEDKLVATPGNRITEELAAGLKAHRDEIMRHVLLRDALEWIGARWPSEAGKEFPTIELHNAHVKVCQVRDSPAGFATYRSAVRTFVRTAQAEIKRLTR